MSNLPVFNFGATSGTAFGISNLAANTGAGSSQNGSVPQAFGNNVAGGSNTAPNKADGDGAGSQKTVSFIQIGQGDGPASHGVTTGGAGALNAAENAQTGQAGDGAAGNSAAQPGSQNATSPGGSARPYTFLDLQKDLNMFKSVLKVQEDQFNYHVKVADSQNKILEENGSKITKLYDGVEKIKNAQGKLDADLRLIRLRQAEMEAYLTELESGLPPIDEVAASTDPVRLNLYKDLDKMEFILKQYAVDLEEVITSINDKNKSNDNKDPFAVIVKIVSEHMDSLQYVNETTEKLNTALINFREEHDRLKTDRATLARNML